MTITQGCLIPSIRSGIRVGFAAIFRRGLVKIIKKQSSLGVLGDIFGFLGCSGIQAAHTQAKRPLQTHRLSEWCNIHCLSALGRRRNSRVGAVWDFRGFRLWVSPGSLRKRILFQTCTDSDQSCW